MKNTKRILIIILLCYNLYYRIYFHKIAISTMRGVVIEANDKI